MTFYLEALKMDTKAEMFMKRSRNEINASILLLNSSNNNILNHFGIPKEETFYSATISHSYYSIFYCAKAMLLTLGIDTKSPEVHKKTYDEFKKRLIDTGILDTKLFMIYKSVMIRAELLLQIFEEEKRKRGKFTYQTIPQANLQPAEESLANAKTFFKHCSTYLN
jgi:uncharacterized protein (UPF0332 family)